MALVSSDANLGAVPLVFSFYILLKMVCRGWEAGPEGTVLLWIYEHWNLSLQNPHLC